MANTRKWTNRKKKYRDYEGESFKLVNENPLKQITGDCVIRAITTATGLEYNQILKDLFEIQLETGHMMCCGECYEIYLERLGFSKQSQPRKSDNTKYTGKEFCAFLKRYSIEGKNLNIVCHIGGHHMVAIKDYQICDTWYSVNGCIGNWWVLN